MKLEIQRRVFRAFADETRLRILNLLSKGELCVCDLMHVLKEPQPKISRHLAYLRRSQLVAGRKDGLWMHYQLTERGMTIFGCLAKVLCKGHDRIDEFEKDTARLKHKKKDMVGCR